MANQECKNCNYRDDGEGENDGKTGRKQCLFALESWGSNVTENSPMVTSDGSCYMAILYTLPTHYCSSWKIKTG